MLKIVKISKKMADEVRRRALVRCHQDFIIPVNAEVYGIENKVYTDLEFVLVRMVHKKSHQTCYLQVEAPKEVEFIGDEKT